MQVTIVSGTPEELSQFFNSKQEKLPTKESPKATQGHIGKWNGDEWIVMQRHMADALNYSRSLKELEELTTRITKE